MKLLIESVAHRDDFLETYDFLRSYHIKKFENQFFDGIYEIEIGSLGELLVLNRRAEKANMHCTGLIIDFDKAFDRDMVTIYDGYIE